MDEQGDTPVWTRWISPEDEALWEERLDERLPGRFVVIRRIGRKRLLLQGYVENRAEAESLRNQFGGRVETLTANDWAVPQSEKRPVIVKVRDCLLVTSESDPAALDQARQVDPDRVILSVPAELAFGTGEHATTATCLRFLADEAKSRARPKESWRMLDLGTGTGVLAMAAKALGAETAVGWENDPLAVAVAIKNARANGFAEGEIKIAQRDVFQWQPEMPEWDVIAANLFSEILIALLPTIRRALKADGTLIISGILRAREEATLRAADEAGFRIDRVKRVGKWVSARGALRNGSTGSAKS